MDIIKTVSPVATIVFLVCALWPLNAAMLALAVKIRAGTNPLDYEDSREYWWRSILGSLGVAVIAWVLLAVMYFLIVLQELTAAAGVIQMSLLLLLIPAAIGFIFWALALEDFMHALSVFGIFVLLPGLLLGLIGAILHAMDRLPQLPTWLLSLH